MNEIKLDEALLEAAQKENDALLRFHAIKNVLKTFEDALAEIKDEVIKEAEKVLEEDYGGRKSGEFEYKDKTFELSVEKVFDFVEFPQRYANEAGKQYREHYYEKENLLVLAKAKTTLLKAIRENFAAENPKWDPDSEIKTIKVKASPKRKG